MVQLISRGTLTGHTDWVTGITTSFTNPNTIVTSSRDKKLIVWELTPEGENYGYAKRALTGHNSAVQDVTLSSDGAYALSGSWDKTLRLWDISSGKTIRTFRGHTGDVFSIGFSADNRQIISAGRDKTIKLWNTLGECKFTIEEDKHNDWVSCVRFSPSTKQPLIVSAGWDKVIKVWNLTNCKLRANLVGHTGVINTLTISPDGSLVASGGKDGAAMLWDINEGKHLYSLTAGSAINSLCFSPKNYWLVAATDKGIEIWDLESKRIIDKVSAPAKYQSPLPWIVSLTWSADGHVLFAGSSDGEVYVYEVPAQ